MRSMTVALTGPSRVAGSAIARPPTQSPTEPAYACPRSPHRFFALLTSSWPFARGWVDSRNQRAPRGRRLASAELRAHGVTRGVVEDVTATIDERDAAYRAAERRARSLAGSPYAEFRRRIAGLLLRRGFNYEIVRETVQKLWHDIAAEGDSR